MIDTANENKCDQIADKPKFKHDIDLLYVSVFARSNVSSEKVEDTIILFLFFYLLSQRLKNCFYFLDRDLIYPRKSAILCHRILSVSPGRQNSFPETLMRNV